LKLDKIPKTQQLQLVLTKKKENKEFLEKLRTYVRDKEVDQNVFLKE